ncbi:RIP metalloprotease RseP [Alcanivorax sp. S6407]|uniref:RIP metalloprotease RseP n=1 Tax=Alcanivorax sp. S6407 TaxID=2926424 RepID=UPI001FF624EB|nr:RIP metalloprotease RseP [Alcanivorax sp. S6407]MCK0152668.1 RIP metalloprotease RseP [Alcanivorax sp. S6407]
MLTVLAFVVTIVIIVAFHEWGHFLAMRAFGVRVLTFSVGFGPKLLNFTDRKGTLWTISAVPLGGYVKPLDAREDETAEGHPGEFSSKPAWQRVITYAAGPVFNFILALLIYWTLLAGYGQSGMRAVIGPVAPGTAAEQAGFQPGDRVAAVGDVMLEGWRPFYNEMILHLGEEQPLAVTVKDASGAEHIRQLDIGLWSEDPEQSPLKVLGLNQAVIIGEVRDGSAAERAGLRDGDLVLSLDGEPVNDWQMWHQAIMDSAGQSLALTVLRNGMPRSLSVVPDEVTEQGLTFGRIGVAAGGIYRQEFSLFSAIPEAGGRFVEQVEVILSSLAKLVTGKLSLDNLGGPITIAQVAGESASIGIASFLALLAYLSITLGVINLLPVPMLDGGWIFFGIIEMIRGRSLPERFLLAAQGVGLTLVVSFMLLAIYNDLVKQFS